MSDIWRTLEPYLIQWLYMIPAIVISLTIHEFCHAYAATKLGDPTPRNEGRLSLNPLHHIDIFGFIVMLLVRFGWAKPVGVNPLYFRNPRKGMMLTAIAGPVSNLVLCIISSLLYFFSVVYSWDEVFIYFFLLMTYLNIGLAFFNLIPIHPLDGSRILSYFVPGYSNVMAQYGEVIQIVFIALLILPGYLPIPDFIGGAIATVQEKVAVGLLELWMKIFGFLIH